MQHPKLLFVIPVTISASMPPGYAPDDLCYPTIDLGSHQLKYACTTLKQHPGGPLGITVTGTCVVTASNVTDAVDSVIQNEWCRLHNHGVSALLDDVVVTLGDGDVLIVDVANGDVVKQATASFTV